MTFIFLILGCITDGGEDDISAAPQQEEIQQQVLESTPIPVSVQEVSLSMESKRTPSPALKLPNTSLSIMPDTTKEQVSKEASMEPRISDKHATIAAEVTSDQKELEQKQDEGKEASKEVLEPPKEVNMIPKKTKKTYTRPSPQCTQQLKKILRDKKGEILFCYDKQKLKKPSLEGAITVQINIHSARNSIWVKKDTLKDKGLRSCIKSKIKHWDFGSECYGASFRKSYTLVSG